MTPLLLVAEKYLVSDTPTLQKSHPFRLSSLVNTIWGTTLVSIFAIFCTADCELQIFALSTIPLATLLLAYISFTPRRLGIHRFLPNIDLQEAIEPLSWRIVLLLLVALSAQTYAFGLPSKNITLTLPLGLIKALYWFFTIRKICITPPFPNDFEHNSRLYVSWALPPR